MYDQLADLYSLLVCMEHLEKSYIRDSITHEEYTPECKKLIAQYKTALNTMGDGFKSVSEFMKEYNVRKDYFLIRYIYNLYLYSLSSISLIHYHLCFLFWTSIPIFFLHFFFIFIFMNSSLVLLH